MCASGKSFRQTIQRVGRSSRLGGFDDALGINNYEQLEVIEKKFHNEYRNKLIVALTIKKIMPTKRSTLLIVNQLDHGKNLQKLFKDQGYDVKFTNGI